METRQSGRKKMFTYFIGIDVARNKLDFAIFNGKQLIAHRETANNEEKISLFLIHLKSLDGFKKSKALFCMEHTGFYCNHLLASLRKFGAKIMVENPMKIKNSLGLLRGKDDKTDAIRIAKYAEQNKELPQLWEPKRPVILMLMNLVALRSRLMTSQYSLNSTLKEQRTFIRKDIHQRSLMLCQGSISAIKSDLLRVETEINSFLDADAHLKHLMSIITSVPGIGPLTAIQIIICTNEFRDITDPKKFACYAGIAPFKKESGLNKGKSRVSPIANKDMKQLLHMCALNAIRYDKELKEYFERKTKSEGKPGMGVVNAVRNKLVLRVFACLNQNRCYIDREKDQTANCQVLTEPN